MKPIGYSWTSADGLKMFGQIWSYSEEPRAAVCLVHGFGEHTGRYQYVGNRLAGAGYALIAFDLRGHGKSEGVRGYTPSYDTLLDDIAHLIKEAGERFPRKPRFLYGHSTGGNLVLNYVIRRQPQIAGVISTSPWLTLKFKPPWWKTPLGRLLYPIAPGFIFSSGLDPNDLSRDSSVGSAYTNDPLVHDRISVQLGMDMITAGQFAIQHCSDVHLPLLLMQGTGDRIVLPEATQECANQVKGDCTLKLWPGFYHELHNETEKEQVIQFMIDWLNQHTQPAIDKA